MSDGRGREIHLTDEEVEVGKIDIDRFDAGEMVPRMRSWSEVDQMMGTGNSFDAMLFRLMHHADMRNWKILAKAYPDQAREYLMWFHGARETK